MRIPHWLGRHRFVWSALAVVLVVAAAGVFVWRDRSSTPSQVPSPAPGFSTGRIAPLTGRTTVTVIDHPAVTVKISNTPDAHPQRGLADADIVFVEPITGATTRLAAIFHSKLPAQVGPVRSLRPMDAALIGPTKGVVADTMADRWVLDYVDRVADLDDLGTLRVPRGTYLLDRARRAPNHVFARPSALLARSARRAPPAPYFRYSSGRQPVGGEPVSTISIGYGGPATASWTYRATDRRWVRTEARGPHLIENDGQVAADNVLLLTAERDTSFPQAKPSMTVLDVVDAAGNVKLFTRGAVLSGRWQKAGVNDPFVFTTTDGNPLLLTPGTTWVECVLPTMPVRMR